MKSFSSVDATSLKGEFRVDAERWADKTRILRRHVSKPFHLAKPYWTGSVLLIHAANTTPGVFANDRLDVEVNVGPGAAVLLTTPSATRIYSMTGGEGTAVQKYYVASGGWLELRPEWLIPQRQSRFCQRTSIECESGAMLFYWECVAPGRVASGEVFQYLELVLEFDLQVAGSRVVREVIRLQPHNSHFCALQRPFQTPYFATGYLVWPRPASLEALQPLIHSWNNDALWIGCSCLDDCCWVFRALAPDALTLRELSIRLRSALATKIPYLAESDRKL